jgi:hypothetical protein
VGVEEAAWSITVGASAELLVAAKWSEPAAEQGDHDTTLLQAS